MTSDDIKAAIQLARDWRTTALIGRDDRDIIRLSDALLAMAPVYEAALAYGASEHDGGANCAAGDCDGCSARPAHERVLPEKVADPRAHRVIDSRRILLHHEDRTMTLTSLLDLARSLLSENGMAINDEADRLARGVLDLLAEAQPCGMEAPEVTREEDVDGNPKPDGEMLIQIPGRWNHWGGADDARHMARMLLHAADRAEGES